MIEQHIDIATADGAMNSFVVHPEEGGPFPVVLFYMDALFRMDDKAVHGAVGGGDVDVLFDQVVLRPVSYTHLTLPTN